MDDTVIEKLIDQYDTVNGKKYYPVSTFALLTRRSEQAIRLLVHKGNRLRKLDAEKFGHLLLIPINELTAFPFCCAGRSKMVIRFNPDGSEYSEYVE